MLIIGSIMFSIIYITTSSMQEARRIGKKLIEEHLAACVNIFPITSIFRWNNDIKEAQEFGMFVKTTADVKKIEKVVKELHSYELPCIISWRIDQGSKDFLKWIEECT